MENTFAGIGELAKKTLRGAAMMARRVTVWPPVGGVRFGSLRRVKPIGLIWPNRRGAPIDRVYIEPFLEREAALIRGEVLEVGDTGYTDRFGADVVKASVLSAPDNDGPWVDYAVDLADAPSIPDNHFDCVILPQTLLFIYDVAAAVRTLHRILKPGGVALVTVPGLTQEVGEDKERWGQYWSFTAQSLERLFGDAFGPSQFEVESHGNVLVATALLYGLSANDLRKSELAHRDPAFPVILTVKATKAAAISE